MVFIEIRWFSSKFDGLVGNSMVLIEIRWFCLKLRPLAIALSLLAKELSTIVGKMRFMYLNRWDILFKPIPL